jgi:acetylornithine/succinyldiaminopimelate/putrescine aminotransferase
LADLQEKFGFLIIADEIQSGIGRTGKFFAFQHYDIAPQLVTIAKPIGGGLPLGAILATEDVAAVLQTGMHGTTFGGNPVACAAGSAVLEEIREKNLTAHAGTLGRLLRDRLESLARDFPQRVREVRGIGLMAGMELDRPGDGVVDAMREMGILINCTDTTVLRFLPPLIVKEEHIGETADCLSRALRTL